MRCHRIPLQWPVVLLFLVGIASACGWGSSLAPPTPTPPAFLANLPIWATTNCPVEEHLRASSYLFEHAERPPVDKSSSIGERGEHTGLVEACENVEVLAYEWSSFKQEFWVLIDTHDGRRGWLAADHIVFGQQ